MPACTSTTERSDTLCVASRIRHFDKRSALIYLTL
jgi:hypothetical protein